jgi:hypothetical protein
LRITTIIKATITGPVLTGSRRCGFDPNDADARGNLERLRQMGY